MISRRKFFKLAAGAAALAAGAPVVAAPMAMPGDLCERTWLMILQEHDSALLPNVPFAADGQALFTPFTHDSNLSNHLE